MSSIISKNPRIIQLELDAVKSKNSCFDDNKTIEFNSKNVIYPVMIKSGSDLSGFVTNVTGTTISVVCSPSKESIQKTVPEYENKRIIYKDTDKSRDDIITLNFPIDINSKIMKNVMSRNVSEGVNQQEDKTGFMYYNVERKTFEDIGLFDPLDGSSIDYDYAIDCGFSAGNPKISFPSQFCTWVQESNLEYDKIGMPTIFANAPNAQKYFATSSQVTKMSCEGPFLVREIRVKINKFQAYREQGTTTSTNAYSGSNKELDNYVLFLYKQNKQPGQTGLSRQMITGSSRSIIGHSSITFWNSGSMNGSLQHSPSFSHEWGLQKNGSAAVATWTGSIGYTFYPSHFGNSSNGYSFAWPADVIGTNWGRYIRNTWPGGVSGKILKDSWQHFQNTFVDRHGFSELPTVEDYTICKSDNHVTNSFGINGAPTIIEHSYNDYFYTTDNRKTSCEYLLFPGDEIILGIEAGITHASGSTKFSSITSSFAQFPSGSEIQIELVGNYIRENSKFFLNRNEYEIDNIKDIIFDEFQIENTYYGSYIDDYVEGEMLIPASDGLSFTLPSQQRRVVFSKSQRGIGDLGALQKFLKLNDYEERTKDSCLPDPIVFLTGSSGFTFQRNLNQVWEQKITSLDTSYIQESVFFTNQFPFENEVTRYQKQKNTLLLNSSGTSIASIPKVDGLQSLSNVLYRVGYTFDVGGTSIRHRNRSQERQASSGSANRYGISSIYPEYSSCKFRYDKFGNLRDQLEQRQDFACAKKRNPIKLIFVSGSISTTLEVTSSIPYME